MLAQLLLVLLNGLVHVTEDDAFLFPLLLHVLVDDLGLVLRADTRQCFLLGFRDPELVEGILDLVGQVLPILDTAAGFDIWADVWDNLVDIDFGEVRAPVGHRHLLEQPQRPKTPLEHPLGLVFVLGDDADCLLVKPLLGLERRVFFFLKFEPCFRVGLLNFV